MAFPEVSANAARDAWLLAVQLSAAVGGLLLWALRDHRRRARARAEGMSADSPSPLPLVASASFRSQLLATSPGDRAVTSAQKAAAALLGCAFLCVWLNADAWPAAVATAVTTLTWLGTVRWLFAVPKRSGAERVGERLVVRRPVRRLWGEVVLAGGASIFVLGFAASLLFYRVDPLSWRGFAVAIAVAASVPLLVFTAVQGEVWFTDAGVIRARRWLPGRRRYSWRELTGVRLVGPELEEPARLELLGFTNIPRVVIPLDADGIGTLALSLLRHLPPSATASPGVRELLEDLATTSHA